MKISRFENILLENEDGLNVKMKLKNGVPVHAECIDTTKGDDITLIEVDLTDINMVRLIAGIIQIKRYIEENPQK